MGPHALPTSSNMQQLLQITELHPNITILMKNPQERFIETFHATDALDSFTTRK